PYFDKNLTALYVAEQLTADQLYEKMVTSLEEVIQLNVLPMREDSENYGRVTLAMVYMLYAEIVMYQNDDSRYSTALKYMEEIISSPQY
ncbi:RagB/SusD family nutrient uptake outer membrane protein, partial [Bacteroides thetaiotaomicron]|nr:RagB/SusD family nutrient uptake outer membrane protein [Bacteroides thetaiotaomicron]